jgi:YaiO family outer membrane protein
MIQCKQLVLDRLRRSAALAITGMLLSVALPGDSTAQTTEATTPCKSYPTAATSESNEVDRFACARQLARLGENAAALVEFHELTIRAPGNVDYWFGLAQVQHRSGDNANALLSLDRARQLAPEYEEIWRLELAVLASRNDDAARVRIADLRASAREQFPDADWLKEPEIAARRPFRWEAGTDVDQLDNDSGNWHRTYVYADMPFNDHDIVYASYARFERYDFVDTQLGVGGSVTLADSWYAALDAMFASRPDFLPETTIGANLGYRVSRGWVIGTGLKHRKYPETEVSSGGLSIEKYLGNFRVAYLAELARLDSETAVTHRATINFYLDRGTQYGLSIAGGKEVESVGAGQILRTSVRAIGLSGRHPLGSYLSIVWRVSAHRQGDFYSRYTTGLSIAGGF